MMSKKSASSFLVPGFACHVFEGILFMKLLVSMQLYQVHSTWYQKIGPSTR